MHCIITVFLDAFSLMVNDAFFSSGCCNNFTAWIYDVAVSKVVTFACDSHLVCRDKVAAVFKGTYTVIKVVDVESPVLVYVFRLCFKSIITPCSGQDDYFGNLDGKSSCAFRERLVVEDEHADFSDGSIKYLEFISWSIDVQFIKWIVNLAVVSNKTFWTNKSH